jgi:uncharacterized membrane protein
MTWGIREIRMTQQAPTEVILAAFNDEQGAQDALERLKEAQKLDLIDIENSAILRRDQQGKLHIKEAKDMGGGRGAVIGGVVGAVAGVLFGPLVLATAGGAAIGGLAAKLRDSGFNDQRLKQVGAHLQPGTSAILAVIEHTWVTEMETELRKAGADVVTEEIGADIANQLKQGKAVAYTAMVTDDSVIATRATADQPSSTSTSMPSGSPPSQPTSGSRPSAPPPPPPRNP